MTRLCAIIRFLVPSSDAADVPGYALMLVSGFAIAVAIEWGALHVLDRWQYAESMPQLPGLGVGVSPVLQMLMLPPIVFKISAWWLGKR